MYDKTYCDALELAYGPGMMAEGGKKAIDDLVSGLDLEGKKILDFGSGVGGLALYLASEYGACVTGLEINHYMVEEATNRIPTLLRDRISFVLYDEDSLTLPFDADSFDIVLSKGVIVHLTNEARAQIFRQFYRILRQSGQLIIGDWLAKEDGVWPQQMYDLMVSEDLYLNPVAPQTYADLVRSVGFNMVNYTDKSSEYIRYNQYVVDNLSSEVIKQQFIEQFGEPTWREHLAGYQQIVDAFIGGGLKCGVIKAQKI